MESDPLLGQGPLIPQLLAGDRMDESFEHDGKLFNDWSRCNGHDDTRQNGAQESHGTLTFSLWHDEWSVSVRSSPSDAK